MRTKSVRIWAVALTFSIFIALLPAPAFAVATETLADEQNAAIAKVKESYMALSYTVEEMNIVKQTLAQTPDGVIGIASEIDLTVRRDEAEYGTAIVVFTALLKQ